MTNTITNKIKALYEKGLNIDEIAKQLEQDHINRSKHYIRNIVYRIRIRKGLLTQTTEQHNSTTTTEEQANPDLTLDISLIEDDTNPTDLILKIKSNKLFEEHLKSTKELRHTTNLWNTGTDGDFYYLELSPDYGVLDNVNTPILKNNKINHAILRIKGISDGLSFKINTQEIYLTSQNTLIQSLKKLTKVYNDYYTKNILNKKLNFSSKVILTE